MKRFFVADWHLGEDRFEIMGRPFTFTADHVATIVQNHNQHVGKDDLVYVVGDVLYQKADPDVWLPWVGRMNGRKILIRGNHDRPFSDEQFAPYFEQIVPEGHGVEINVDGLPCWVTHYPTQGRDDRFNIVGHIHGVWKVQLNMLNVGVDVHHFSPVPEERINFFYNAICKYFDEDAWVGYNAINAKYRDIRGMKGRYFNEII